MKKHVFLVVLYIFLVISFIGCGGGKKQDTVLGKWEITKAEGTLADMNVGAVYEFLDETNMTIDLSGFKNKATYKLEENTLTAAFGPVTVKAEIKLDGDTLTYSIIGSDQVFHLVRKK